jgi:hypothetical protein
VALGVNLFHVIDWFVTGGLFTDKFNSTNYALEDYVAWAYWRALQPLPYRWSDYTTFVMPKHTGDDSVKMLSDGHDWNNFLYRDYMRDLFGVEVTSADKGALTQTKSVPNFLYLRRSPVFFDFAWHLALESASIFRPLNYCRDPSPAAMANVFDSILTEVYETGDREKFALCSGVYATWAARNGISWTPTSWEVHSIRWHAASPTITYEEFEPLEDSPILRVTSKSGILASEEPQVELIGTAITDRVVDTDTQEVQGPEPQSLDVLDVVAGHFNPIPMEPNLALAKRQIKVATFTITDSNVVGDSVYVAALPKDLVATSVYFNQSGINFPRVRFRVLISFKATIPAFQTGMLMLSFCPMHPNTAERRANMYQRSCNHAVEVPFASAGNFKYPVPFFEHRPWLSFTDLPTTVTSMLDVDMIARFKPKTGGRTSFSFDVYANLVDIEFGGVITAPEFMPLRVTSKSEVERKAGSPPPSDVILKVSVASPEKKPKKEKKSKGVESKLVPPQKSKAPKPSAEAAAKTTSVLAGTTAPTGTSIIGDIATGITNIFGVIGNTVKGAIGAVAPYAGDIMGGIAKVLPFMLDKPTDERPPMPMIHVSGTPLAHTRTLQTNSVALWAFPSAPVAPIVGGCPSVYDAMRTPSLLQSVEVDDTAISDDVIFVWPMVAERMCHHTRTATVPNKDLTVGWDYVYDHNFLTWYVGAYGFYRGSYKFRINCVCAATTAMRVRFSISIGPQGFPIVDFANECGTLWTEIVDIHGPTIKEFTVPFSNLGVWIPVLSLGGADQIHDTNPTDVVLFFATVEDVPTATDDATLVTFLVYGAAAEDFQVAELTGMLNRITAEPAPIERVTGKCSLTECFDKPFPNTISVVATVVSRINIPDDETNIVQVAKRFTYRSALTAATKLPWAPPFNSELWLWLSPYRQASGGMRFLVDAPAANGRMAASRSSTNSDTTTATRAATGVHLWDTTKVSQQVLEVPYVSETFFCDTGATTPTNLPKCGVYVTGDAYTSTNIYQAVADDFAVCNLLAPYGMTFSNTVSAAPLPPPSINQAGKFRAPPPSHITAAPTPSLSEMVELSRVPTLY